ncbi:MAG TPA: hypothetical protein VJM46_00720 [Candidatus Saccharimonadales bacterium]|nr:hypothetical protein [Candidatus Saccharimonadales bacterium]
MSRTGTQRTGWFRWWYIPIVLAVVGSLIAGYLYWTGRPTDPAAAAYRDIGGNVSLQDEAPEGIKAVVDTKISKPPLKGVEPLGDIVHVTPDGQQSKQITLRFKLNRVITDPRDVVIAVNRTGKAEDWRLVAPTKVEGEYAYVTTDHLSWWDPLWRSFTDLVDATVKELKYQFDGLGGDAFAEAEKPKCKDEDGARDKGYSIKHRGAEVLYYCLGLDGGKPVVNIANKRRYPVFINHKGISVPEKPKSKLSLEILGRQSFSNDRTVMMPFDQLRLNYDLGKGDSKSFTTEYNGFAESIYQLEFGVTTLINILTRFGAGGGTISNGAINISKYDQIAEAMSKFLTVKDCVNALNNDKPNVGAIVSGCFSPDAIMTAFGWKGVLAALVMVAGPVVNFFRNSFDTLGDLLQGKDQETVTVNYSPPPPVKALFVGEWHVHGAGLTIKKDGTGSYTWNAGPCTDSIEETRMCQGNADLTFKINGDGKSMTGTYSRVWYTSDGRPAPPDFDSPYQDRMQGMTFTVKRNDEHTLITADGTGSRPGNPYLCDAYAGAHNDSEYQLCGA